MVLVIWERPERKEELVSLVFGGLRYKDDDDDNDQNGKDGVKREGPVQIWQDIWRILQFRNHVTFETL